MIATVGSLRRGGVDHRRPGGALTENQLRRWWRARLRQLQLRPPLDAGELCERLAAARGRPIVLEARVDIPIAGGYGFLLPSADIDLIVYQRNTSPAGQAWIVFHELTHLLRGHITPGGAPLVCGALLGARTDLPAGATLYDEPREWEAETAAGILSEWAHLPAAPPGLDAPDRATRAITRAFGGAGSWA